MNSLEIIEQLCDLLDRAQQIIRQQAEILEQHNIRTCDGEVERHRAALLAEFERSI